MCQRQRCCTCHAPQESLASRVVIRWPRSSFDLKPSYPSHSKRSNRGQACSKHGVGPCPRDERLTPGWRESLPEFRDGPASELAGCKRGLGSSISGEQYACGAVRLGSSTDFRSIRTRSALPSCEECRSRAQRPPGRPDLCS